MFFVMLNEVYQKICLQLIEHQKISYEFFQCTIISSFVIVEINLLCLWYKHLCYLFHITRTIREVNGGISHSLKINDFTIDYIIISVFNEITDFCSIVKTFTTAKSIFLRIVKLLNLALPRVLNATVHKKLSLMLLVMETLLLVSFYSYILPVGKIRRIPNAKRNQNSG